MNSISIIIPNWNGRELLEKNLPSVLASAKGAEIIIVDDASTDESVAFLQKEFPQVKVIEKERNEGFASTVNTGVAAAKGDIVVLLNTDVRPEKGFLAPLVKHFEDSRVFAVGCMDRSHEKEVILRGRGVASWKKGFFVHARGEVDATTTAWVNGGSGAFRKSYWEKLGGMDTLYNPFYWEDIDLSYRALKAGYALVFEPKSVVDHFHEEGKIKSAYTKYKVKQIAYRNQFIFIWKNLTDKKIMRDHLLWLPIRLLLSLTTRDWAMTLGFISALKKFPEIQRKRSEQRKFEIVADADVLLL